MNTEIDLMAPRIKVTGLYPGCDFEMGEVIHASLDGRFMVYEDWGVWEIKYELYPHLFQPLPWYAEREESQMPEYVKQIYTGQVAKAYWIKTNYFFAKGIDRPWNSALYLLPTTKEEYEDYQTLKKQNV